MANVETNRQKVLARLTREGWTLSRHGGEHDIYAHAILGGLSLPRHRTLSLGVARSIAKAAGWR